MYQIGVVSSNRQLLEALNRTLSQYRQGPVLQFSDAARLPSSRLFEPPAALVVDITLPSSTLSGFFQELYPRHPEVTIVLVTTSETRPAREEISHWGVDEVLVWPTNEVGQREITARLLQRLALCEQITSLLQKLRKEMGENQIVAKSKALREIVQRLPTLAESASTVLITGETGTGKELLARAIHYLGPRAGYPFVTVDCGAISEHLLENELFGHVRGAYTNADDNSKGLLAEAERGTLLLDEVEALPLHVQSKFLRFLQERQYKPLGQAKYLSANVRVLAATNLDLKQEVEKNRFRADLYYRLNVVPLTIPPLRERKADLPALAHHFMAKHRKEPAQAPAIPPEVLHAWLAYDWPGNVRELENKVQQWLTLPGCEPRAEEAFAAKSGERIRTLAEVREAARARCERAYLRQLLAHTHGNISTAAKLADMHRKNLAALLKKYAIHAKDFSL
jgi:DNA-binding NtrC family response regulator